MIEENKISSLKPHTTKIATGTSSAVEGEDIKGLSYASKCVAVI